MSANKLIPIKQDRMNEITNISCFTKFYIALATEDIRRHEQLILRSIFKLTIPSSSLDYIPFDRAVHLISIADIFIADKIISHYEYTVDIY